MTIIIFPLVMILICVAFLGVILVMSTGGKKKTEGVEVAAQDFMNVRDIVDHVLYTMDDYCISYVKIQPPMSSLWSKQEKRMKTNTIVAEASKDREGWMLTAVSRPMDITYLVNQYRTLRDNTDNPYRKKILKEETRELKKKVIAGEAVERQFYLKIWEPLGDGVETDLLERARQLVSVYESVGIAASVLNKPDIIRFCNLVHNPAYINVESESAESTVPMIREGEE